MVGGVRRSVIGPAGWSRLPAGFDTFVTTVTDITTSSRAPNAKDHTHTPRIPVYNTGPREVPRLVGDSGDGGEVGPDEGPRGRKVRWRALLEAAGTEGEEAQQ
jgi:hypothetical protein